MLAGGRAANGWLLDPLEGRQEATYPIDAPPPAPRPSVRLLLLLCMLRIRTIAPIATCFTSRVVVVGVVSRFFTFFYGTE